MTPFPITVALATLLTAAAPEAVDAAPAAGGFLDDFIASRLDQAVLLFAVALGVFGMFSGAIRQISNIVALIAAYNAASPLGALMSPVLAEITHLPLFFLTLGSCILAFFAVYGLAYVLTRMLLKRVLPDGESGFINRAGGLLMGVAKAAVMAFVILSGMVLAEGFMAMVWQRFPHETEVSRAYNFARRNSLFARLAQFETLETLLQASGDRDHPRTLEALDQLETDPELKALASDPRISAIAADTSIQQAVTQGNYAALFSNEKVQEVLNDQELFDNLGRVRASLGHEIVFSNDGSDKEDEASRDDQIDAMGE